MRRRRLSPYPAPLDRLPPSVAAALTGQGGAVAPVVPTHWFQPSAANAEFLTAANASYPATGGFIAIINPTAIGSTRGGIIDLRGTGAVWMAIVPGAPDTLRLSVNIGGAARNLNVAFPGGDAALYDGAPKVAWGRWEQGGNAECGWGKPSDGNTSGVLSTPSTVADATATASVGNVAGANSSIGGEYEIAAFTGALTDAMINAVVDALSIVSVTAGRFLYPRPAAGVSDGDAITDPSTQVTDDTAHTWTISTVDGTSSIQAAT